MYCHYYELEQNPFHITPDPTFFFMSPHHEGALATLIDSLSKRQGMVAIIGDAGLGKTTLLRAYLVQAQRWRCKTIYVTHADLVFRNLLQVLYQALELDFARATLDAFCTACQQQRAVILVIDDAHMMPLATLKKLCTLAQRGASAEPLLHIVLVGHAALISKLDALELQRLAPCPVVRYTLSPLTPKESRAYIYHRLAQVTDQAKTVFTSKALTQIVKVAQGIPGALNILCTNALLAGFGSQQRPVSARVAWQAIAPLQGNRQSRLGLRGLIGVASLGLLTGLVMVLPASNLMLDRLQNYALSPLTHFVSHQFHAFHKGWSARDSVAPIVSQPSVATPEEPKEAKWVHKSRARRRPRAGNLE